MKKTVIDTTGRTVSIRQPVKRIVLLSTAAARAVQILGADDRVVGINETIQNYPFYFPVIAQKPLLGTWKEVDWEKIASLEPDLVIAYAYAPGPINVTVAEEKLKSSDIPVVGLNLYISDRYEQLFGEFEKLALLLGKEEEAQRYLDWHANYETGIQDFIEQKERPKVFLTRSTGALGKTTNIRTYGPYANLSILCEKAGGKPLIPNGTTRYPKISAEKVLEENPEVVILSAAHIFGWWDSPAAPKNLVDKLLKGKGWDTMNATINNRIYVVPYSIICGLEHTYGIALLTKIFYPDLDIEPAEVYKEFLEDFMRVGYPEGQDKVLAYSGSTIFVT